MVEFDHFKQEAGLHTFTLSVSDWIGKTDATGLMVKKGRYGGTFAHKDIAFEFASAISPVFKLYLIKEFQRLKEQENDLKKIEWDAKRFLSKNNYLIQTDAVKNYLIPVCNYREDRKQTSLMLLFLGLQPKLGEKPIRSLRKTAMSGTMLP